MTISSFLLGALAVVVGVLLLKYNYQVVGFTGHIDAIERRLGSGSTYFAMKIFALLVIFIGFVYAVGLGDNVLGWLLSPIRNAFPGASN